MTNIEKAIREAVEKGGYARGKSIFTADGVVRLNANPELFFLDPAFWQALGKARGWDSKKKYLRFGTMRLEWQHKWHYFIDHLAEGKDPAESFFATL